MGDIESFCPGKTHSRLKNIAGRRQGHLGKRAHIFDMIQKIKAADDIVMGADHLAGQLHEVDGLGLVSQNVGGADQNLFGSFRGKAVPFLGLGKRIGHVGQHGHVKMGAAAVFQRKKSALIEIRPDQAVFGQPEAIAAVGLGDVPAGGVGEMDMITVAHLVQKGLAVPSGIAVFLPLIRDNLGQNRMESAQALIGPAAVFA